MKEMSLGTSDSGYFSRNYPCYEIARTAYVS
jgi:hypothetical protein